MDNRILATPLAILRWALVTVAIFFAIGPCFAAAAAADLRDYCPDRPGLGTPPCTIDKGHGDLEIGLADWTLDREGGTRTDDLAFADLLVRYGLSDTLEAQIHWTAFGTERIRAPGGAVQHSNGTGDIGIALRQNLINPDGSGFSLALMPVLTLPTGSGPLGGGTWGASLVVPAGWQLSPALHLDFTGVVAAAPDADGKGRHFAYGGVAGLDIPLGKDVGATFELAASRDQDPAGSSDQLLGGVSLGWMVRPNLQLDAGANLGLAGAAPDLEVYAGVSRRF